jgi:hypothetical protein
LLLYPIDTELETWLVPSGAEPNCTDKFRPSGGIIYVARSSDTANLSLFSIEENRHRIAGFDLVLNDDFHFVGRDFYLLGVLIVFFFLLCDHALLETAATTARILGVARSFRHGPPLRFGPTPAD